MTPRDILDVADTLITGIKEGEWRSAVSRAYYAAFHAARRLLAGCGFTVPQAEQAHGYVWLRLSNSGHPDVVDAGKDLAHLRTMRNWADYDLDQPMDHSAAIGYVQTAGAILQLLESVPTVPAVLTQITDAMKTYEKDVLKQVTWHP